MKARTPPRQRRITRYHNRKLYEPAERRYVTVADVGGMVVAGDDVQVQDQKSGQDLTAQVLAQVLLDQLKERTASIPRQVLVGLIRLGAGKSAWADWPDPQHAAARVRAEAERIAAGLLARGRLSIDEALSLRQEIAQSLHAAAGETQRAIEARLRALFERGDRRRGVGPALQGLDRRLRALGSTLDGRRRGREKRARPARGPKRRAAPSS